MSYANHPSNDGSADPQFSAPPSPVAPTAKKSTGKVALAVAGGLLGLCCVGGVISAAGDDEKDDSANVTLSAPSAAAATTTATTPRVVVPTSAAAPVVAETTPSSAAATTPPAPQKVRMPNLRGENAAVALDTLEKLGFTDIRLGSADEDDTFVLLAANWTVKKQSAKAGKKIALDTLIVLTCTKQ